MSGEMLDNYLIAQALGWDWNFWTMLTLTGIELVCFLPLFVFVEFYVCGWIQNDKI